MLAADKLQLQTTLKQQATALKEKEFKLHHENLMTVGTQAAVLAGLDVTMLIELSPALESDWIMSTEQSHLIIRFFPRIMKLLYYTTITSALCANIFVVGQTTILSVMGASLALRGPDGSMMTATDGLYKERSAVFKAFGYGLAATLCSVVLGVWLILPPEAAFLSMICTCFTGRLLKQQYYRIRQKFEFNEEDTVDFSDLFDGPGNVNVDVATPRTKKKGLGGFMNGYGGRNRIKQSPNTSFKETSSSDDEENAHAFNQQNTKRRRNRNLVRQKGSAATNDYDYEDSLPLITTV